jgi:hypothetical protein
LPVYPRLAFLFVVLPLLLLDAWGIFFDVVRIFAGLQRCRQRLEKVAFHLVSDGEDEVAQILSNFVFRRCFWILELSSRPSISVVA